MKAATQLLQEIKSTIHRLHPHARIILFGSRAKGNARPDSDWDLLILLPDVPSPKVKREIRDRLFEVELQQDCIISSIILSQNDWLNRAITPLYRQVSVEGLAL
jgi:uncharacterized protein